jgi:hypothetical protein
VHFTHKEIYQSLGKKNSQNKSNHFKLFITIQSTAFFFFFLFSNLGYGGGGKTFQQPKAHVTNIEKCFQKLSGKCHFYEKALG